MYNWEFNFCDDSRYCKENKQEIMVETEMLPKYMQELITTEARVVIVKTVSTVQI